MREDKRETVSMEPDERKRVRTLAVQMEQHLKSRLIPFWEGLMDQDFGGFYGFMDYERKVDQEAVKGCILNSRILWFFSSAAVCLGDRSLLAYAGHAYEFLKNCCLDREMGGVFWSVTREGAVYDGTKHTYNQAFAIYALSAYYEAAGSEEALGLAEELFRLIETACRDEGGYLEAFDRNFVPVSNEKLSENGVLAERTMNTLLHVFEAYTEYYRVSGDASAGARLKEILRQMEEQVYNRERKRLEVFFDRDMKSLIDLHSYGHDIEASWLLDRGCELLKGEARTASMTRELAEEVYRKAYTGHSLLNENENGIDDTDRIWWVQAEAVTGFFNVYEKDRERKEYLAAAEAIWEYIKEYLLDPRPGSEWFWKVDAGGRPYRDPIVEPWKCPYHNGRMCMEIIRRTRHAAS